jgi:hypothetical protein
MGEPLQLLEAWGQDEELLAICGYLCGGQTHLLPLTVGHVYAAPRLCEPSPTQELIEVWANRLAVIEALPMDAETRADMIAWHERNGLPHNRIRQATAARADRICALREHLTQQGRTWADAVRALSVERAVLNAPPVPRVSADAQRYAPRAKAPTAAPANATPPDTCERCGHVRELRAVKSVQVGSFGDRVRQCGHCGHRQQARAA